MIAIFPETLTFAEKGMIEHLAVSARRYFERKRTPRLDLDSLLQNMGIVLDRSGIDALGALLAQDRNGRFSITIVLGKLLDPFSQKFIKAHLLGHYLLHLQPMIARGDLVSSGFKELACPLQRYCVGGSEGGEGMAADLERAREEQCDLFAGALLIPKGMLMKAWTSLQDSEKLAEFFGVTKKCLQRRMIDVGLVVREPQSFYEAEKTLRRESHLKNLDLESPGPKEPQRVASQSPKFPDSYGREKVLKPESHKNASPKPELLAGAGGMDRVREIAKMLDKSRS